MNNEDKIAIIVGVLVLLVALSPLLLNKNDNEYTYNSFKIQKIPSGWMTWAYEGEQPYQLKLRHGPKTLENITIDSSIRDILLSKPSFALTINPKQELKGKTVVAAGDIANILGRALGLIKLHVFGATTEYANDGTLIVDCGDIQENLNVAWLRLGIKPQFI